MARDGNGTLTLEDPEIAGLKPSAFRSPDAARNSQDAVEEDMVIVSADGHHEISEDIFYEHFPAHLKDKAPRVWFDEWWHIGNKSQGQSVFNAIGETTKRIVREHSCSGLYDRAVRRTHLSAEGVQKEIVFPQSVLVFSTVADLEIREQLYRVYNEYIARQNALDPTSFYGVGVCSNWWMPEKARDAIAQITSLGLKAVMLPNNPGKYPSGKDIAWGDAELEPFWDAVEEAALPVCFHVVETLQAEGRGVYPTFTLSSLAPFRKPFGQLAFGGVFDRNPTLKAVFVEGGISWVPVMLQDAENIFDGFGSLIEPRPKHRPSHYWFENCYATFQLDRLGLEWLHYIGPGNVMWGADYPHTEGTFGYTRHSRRVVREMVGGDAARNILGGTALRVFNL